MLLLAESREDVWVTFFTGSMYPKLMEEMARIPQGRLKRVQNRVNVIDVASNAKGMFDAPEFENAIQQLFDGSGKITCLTSKKIYTSLPKPNLVIVDPVAGYAIEAIRKIAAPEKLPIWSWMTSSVGATVALWGPKHLGGRGDDWKEVNILKTEEERSARTVELLSHLDDKIISIPGYPPMHHYEYQPQEQKIPVSLSGAAVRIGYKYLYETDGYISVTTSILEEDATKAWKEYFHSLGKDFYEIGFIAATMNTAKEDDVPAVSGFLLEMQQTRGEKSVVYVSTAPYFPKPVLMLEQISFGSAWWPGNPDMLYAVIDELIESKTPFLIANPSPFPSSALPEGAVKRIDEYPFGHATKWAPQEAVLEHPAVGWFISHAGWNGLQESVSSKVPA
ncbi:hypothetical protein V5O48_009155 [Marasmius crinis-equi]|uniref:Uncharacterized protein n=1 Tax=Marasmius crinis-equi TaxID=585013 RepID=A0ABR3FC88_9AGAR